MDLYLRLLLLTHLFQSSLLGGQTFVDGLLFGRFLGPIFLLTLDAFVLGLEAFRTNGGTAGLGHHGKVILLTAAAIPNGWRFVLHDGLFTSHHNALGGSLGDDGFGFGCELFGSRSWRGIRSGRLDLTLFEATFLGLDFHGQSHEHAGDLGFLCRTLPDSYRWLVQRRGKRLGEGCRSAKIWLSLGLHYWRCWLHYWGRWLHHWLH